MNKTINLLSAALVAALALCAFTVSYEALRGLALGAGVVSPTLAVIWPFLVDGALVVFGLAALRNSLLGDSTLFDMILVLAFTALSVALNVLHAPGDVVARFIAAIAPVALFLSFERLMSMGRSDSLRAGAVDKLANILARLDDTRRTLAATEAAITDKQAELEAIRTEIEAASRQAESAEVAVDDITARRMRLAALLAVTPGAAYDTLAGALGISARTAQRDVAALEEAGVVHRNGNGPEVVL